MKFALSTEMHRESPDTPMERVLANSLEVVRLADRAGFHSVFTGEHHGIELSIAPNPFTQLAVWARETERIRLGSAVVCAPYWHPMRLAGEVGLVDLLSGGRVEVGIGRGAYTYEFERMAPGVDPAHGREALAELVPALKGLWGGDYAHDGAFWKFPAATAVPRPVQTPHPPIWISARHPDVFRFAVENECDIMATPLHLPFAEVESLKERLDTAVAEAGGGFRPKLMMLRNAAVYEDAASAREVAGHLKTHMRYFDTLFRNTGGVRGGFVDLAAMEVLAGKENYDDDALVDNHVFGTPEQVVEKLRRYEAAGVDTFMYGASWGLPHEQEMRSLELFATEVMPAFAEQPVAAVGGR